MKKQYITPLTEVELMDMTELIAESLPLVDDDQLQEDEILAPGESLWNQFEF